VRLPGLDGAITRQFSSCTDRSSFTLNARKFIEMKYTILSFDFVVITIVKKGILLLRRNIVNNFPGDSPYKSSDISYYLRNENQGCAKRRAFAQTRIHKNRKFLLCIVTYLYN
jgi:hypothetical protein